MADCLGHPCLPYTLDFWKKFDLEKERRIQREKNHMDSFGYLTDEETGRFSTRPIFEPKEVTPTENNLSSETSEDKRA